jgi:hypothetical protein
MEQVKLRGWSGRDLEAELRQGCLPARQGSGRKPTPPKNALAGLTQLHRLVTTTSNRFEVLFSESFHLAGELGYIPGDEVNEEIRDSVAQASQKLRDISAAAKEHAEDLDGVIETFDGVFTSRIKAADHSFQPERTGVPSDL